jgi:hypothetical protein
MQTTAQPTLCCQHDVDRKHYGSVCPTQEDCRVWFHESCLFALQAGNILMDKDGVVAQG